MITLKKLDSIIKRCCSVVSDDSKDVTDRYSFSIDFDKLEKLLNPIDSNLHPLVSSKSYRSKIIEFDDIQNLVEYLHNSDEMAPIFDGKSEFVKFLIYSAKDKNSRVVNFKDSDGSEVDGYHAYMVKCDDGSSYFASSVLQTIVQNLPMYMVLVIRYFDTKKDRYEYKIHIRSNYEMVSYFKAMTADKNNETADK